MLGALPFDQNGVLALPKQDRSAVKAFLEQRNIGEDVMLDILRDRFNEFLDAVVASDEDKIKTMAEKRFADKIIFNLPAFKKAGLEFKRGQGLCDIKSKTDETLGDKMAHQVAEDYIVDMMLVRGLSVDRDENSCNFDYELNRSEESQGLRFYQHKYFTGYQNYFEYIAYEDKLARVDELKKIVWSKEDENKKLLEKKDLSEEDRLQAMLPPKEITEYVNLQREVREVCQSMRKTMFEQGLKMHLRAMVCFHDIGLFNGEGRLYGENYSGNHIAVFECDLKIPPFLSLIDSNDEEFIN